MIIFLVKSFLGNFYRHLALFFWSHWLATSKAVFFKNGLFFVYFRSFQTNNTFITSNHCEKMSCPPSVRCRDSNPQPSKFESPPITTRPGLPPTSKVVCQAGQNSSLPAKIFCLLLIGTVNNLVSWSWQNE